MLTTSNQYGNPTAEMMQWITKSSFLDNLFTVFSQEKFPPSESELVKEELLQVCKLMDELKKPESQGSFERYRLYDRSLKQYVSGFTFKNDPQAEEIYKELVAQVFDDVSPLVYKLKMHHQRPRPFQLASMHAVPLYPHASFSAQSPAFPCLHSTVSLVLSFVIGNRITSTYKYFKDMANDVYHSRLYLGLCLPSDANAGRRLAEKIVTEPEFLIKYSL